MSQHNQTNEATLRSEESFASLRDGLTQARALIADPAKHCATGHYAVASDGHAVESDSDEAVRWCVIGACRRIYGIDVEAVRKLLADVCEEHYGTRDYIDVNDRRGHAAILSVLDAAIERVS